MCMEPVGDGAMRVTTGRVIRRAAVGDAGLIPREEPRPSPAARATAAVRAAVAAHTDRWRLWTPVAFGGGCALYLGLAREPPLWPLVLLAAVLAVAAGWAIRRGGWWLVPLVLAACLAAGLAVAKLRAEAVAGPVAVATTEPVRLEGWVVDVDGPGGRGARVVVAPTWIGGVAPGAMPHRVRLTLRGAPPPPGTALGVLAILNPPPPPASPGAFDFARDAWFRGLGGSAFALTEARPAFPPRPPWRLRAEMAVNAARFVLAERIVARMGQPAGGVAAAMTTGHEAWLSREDTQAMRDSGLAHILSISGLHMAIVGGFVFFAARLLVAAWPWLALRVPGKKLAAAVGALAVGVYLVVSGAPPPAERAAIVAWTAFAAILLDRRAISMNALALAALIVLLRRPESVVQPGFQMSFAATAALVALAEAWPVRVREIRAPWPIVGLQRARAWLLAACAASLVAGLATGPFAMHHFNRTALFGLAANLAVAPISSFVMMPSLAVGAALESVGLGGPLLAVSGWSIEAMLAIGRFVAGLPGAVRTVPSAPAAALPVAFLGLLFVCLWRGRGRWLGAPFALAVLLWPRAAPPDVWIADQAANAAVRQGERALLLRPEVRAFAVDLWSRRHALAAEVPETGRTCVRFACVVEGPAGGLALWWGRRAPDPDQLSALCEQAAMVALRPTVAELPAACASRLVLDGTDLARGGSVELRSAGEGWTAVWARDLRGERPWVQ